MLSLYRRLRGLRLRLRESDLEFRFFICWQNARDQP
jgi:hypothetical protein